MTRLFIRSYNKLIKDDIYYLFRFIMLSVFSKLKKRDYKKMQKDYFIVADLIAEETGYEIIETYCPYGLTDIDRFISHLTYRLPSIEVSEMVFLLTFVNVFKNRAKKYSKGPEQFDLFINVLKSGFANNILYSKMIDLEELYKDCEMKAQMTINDLF